MQNKAVKCETRFAFFTFEFLITNHLFYSIFLMRVTNKNIYFIQSHSLLAQFNLQFTFFEGWIWICEILFTLQKSEYVHLWGRITLLKGWITILLILRINHSPYSSVYPSLKRFILKNSDSFSKVNLFTLLKGE